MPAVCKRIRKAARGRNPENGRLSRRPNSFLDTGSDNRRIVLFFCLVNTLFRMACGIGEGIHL